MHVLLIETAVKDFKVATAAIDVLFMLHGELDDERLVFVAKRSEFVGKSIEASVLRCLET